MTRLDARRQWHRITRMDTDVTAQRVLSFRKSSRNDTSPSTCAASYDFDRWASKEGTRRIRVPENSISIQRAVRARASNGNEQMTESQREKLVRRKLIMLKKTPVSVTSTTTTSRAPTASESQVFSSTGLPYAKDIENILSNPLVELVLAFMCIILTGDVINSELRMTSLSV